MKQRVIEAIVGYRMANPGDTVVVAVSGGPDSLALGHLLAALRRELAIELHIAHLNHQLRGKAADADAAFVAKWAAAADLPATVESRDVGAYAREHRLCLEDAARRVRYRWLEAVADRVGARRIAVGHNADDRAETILLNLLRGSGTDGLAGMPPKRGRIIRPLFDVSRSEVEAYCREHGLRPRKDATNESPVHLRNRVRRELLPLLEASYQSNIRGALLRLGALAAHDAACLRELATTAFEQALIEKRRDRVTLMAERLASLPRALRGRVLRHAVRRLRGSVEGLELTHVEAVDDILRGSSGRQVDLPGGLIARKDGVRFSMCAAGERAAPDWTGERELAVPGVTEVAELGLRIEAVALGARTRVDPWADDPWLATLDGDRLGEPLVVRTWRRGDAFRPLGMRGTMKLHDFFVNQKVPREERRRVPLVVGGDEIVWVVGHRVDDRCKVTAKTKHLLRLIAARVD